MTNLVSLHVFKQLHTVLNDKCIWSLVNEICPNTMR